MPYSLVYVNKRSTVDMSINKAVAADLGKESRGEGGGGGEGSPYFALKKKNTEGTKAGKARKTKPSSPPPPPPPLAHGLDSSLLKNSSFVWCLDFIMDVS